MWKNIIGKFYCFFFFIPKSFGQKVFSVAHANQADIKVFVVDYENQSDLKV